MTFEEKLGRAKRGSRSAYESLCAGSIDRLYTAALISLRSEEEARAAVIAAISDGYSGISRIRDERHLRSWLVHELTKNMVDKLREHKTNGTQPAGSGVFAASDKLPDVERLVFSIQASLGYGIREISVLTGMSESAVSEKLGSAREHLAGDRAAVERTARSFEAPEPLHERYRVFDESAVAAAQEESAPVKEEPAPVKEEPAPVKKEPAPVEEEPAPVQEAPKPRVAPFPAAKEQPSKDDEAVFTDEDDDEEDDEDYGDEPVFADDDEGGRTLSDAETFIAVVSAEKIKGSEFLRLIGNTRISNSVYREIEQNPKLTRKRLIELLEQSPLTEEDYYKMLTAIKHRREIIDAREQSRIVHAKAGLYDGSQRKRQPRRRQEQKTDLQLALERNRKEDADSRPLTFDGVPPFGRSSDYEVQTASGDYSSGKRRSMIEEHEARVKEDNLNYAVYNAEREAESRKPDHILRHTDMQDIFAGSDEEAVDPFAAIAANATGKQVKPDRKENRSVKWGSDNEEKKLSEADRISSTREFDTEPGGESSSGTKEFDRLPAEPEATKPEPPKSEPPKAPEPPKAAEPAKRSKDIYASGMHSAPPADISVTRLLDGDDQHFAEFAASEDENTTAGFSPDIDAGFAPVDGSEDDERYGEDTGDEGAEPEEPEEQDVDPAADDVTAEKSFPEDEDEDDDDDGSFDTHGRRRYKGNEYFHDDDRFYEGVNRGKIIFCAVCAVLLVGGATAMRFLPAENNPENTPPAVTDENGSTVTETQDGDDADTPATPVLKAELKTLASYEVLLSDAYKGDKPEKMQNYRMTALSADGEPYEPVLNRDFIVSGNTMYVYSAADMTLRAVDLGGDEPGETASVSLGECAYMEGMTVIDGKLYVVTQWVTPKYIYYVKVETFDDKLEKTGEFAVSGQYASAGICGGKLYVEANFFPAEAAASFDQSEAESTQYDSRLPYYAADGDMHEFGADSISVIDGASYAGTTVIGCPDDGTAAAVAGGCAQHGFAQYRDDGITLVRHDEGRTYAVELTPSLRTKGAEAYIGEAFSGECVGSGGMIGWDPERKCLTAYKNGTVISSAPSDHRPYAIAWSGSTAYVMTASDTTVPEDFMLYGFDMSGDVPAAAEITSSDVYTERLKTAGDMLVGLKPEAAPDGERSGLKLSLYKYGNTLTEQASCLIGLDGKTPRENMKYLSSPAEQDCSYIAMNDDATLFAVPTVYFDGFSEVERIVVLRFDGSTLTEDRSFVTYDEKSSQICPVISGDKLYVYTSGGVKTYPLTGEAESEAETAAE